MRACPTAVLGRPFRKPLITVPSAVLHQRTTEIAVPKLQSLGEVTDTIPNETPLLGFLADEPYMREAANGGQSND